MSQRKVVATAATRLRKAGLAGLAVPLFSSALIAFLIASVFASGKDARFLAGTFLYVLTGHLFLYIYLCYFHPETVARRRNLIAIHIPMVLVVGVAGAVQLDAALSYFLVPYAFGALLLTLLFRPSVAAAVSIATVAILAHLYPSAFPGQPATGPIFTALAGQFLGIFAVRRTRKRIQVFWAGFAVAGLNVALAILFIPIGLIEGPAQLGIEVFCGFWGGLLAGMAVAVLPVFENLLDITTVFKIQELADLDHPVLRNLFLRAPGTYQHSMAVSNLAVTAAEAIGADWLLCRVGAYFHDIGKAEIPHYFAENEGYGGRSRHEDLKPSLSASVIKSHVSKGLKIAQEHNLPSAVCDFIPQHHGTSVIRFFYGKALESNLAGPDSKAEYRYSGPRPRTKETAIVMLADSVEAVSRTLEKPSPSAIEETVREMVRQRLLDGDLDESNLTLRELDTIAGSFIKVLNGIFHARPEYPSADEIDAAEKETGDGARPEKEGVEEGKGRNRKPRKAATG